MFHVLIGYIRNTTKFVYAKVRSRAHLMLLSNHTLPLVHVTKFEDSTFELLSLKVTFEIFKLGLKSQSIVQPRTAYCLL